MEAQADLSLPWVHMSEGKLYQVAAQIIALRTTRQLHAQFYVHNTSLGRAVTHEILSTGNYTDPSNLIQLNRVEKKTKYKEKFCTVRQRFCFINILLY